MITWAERAKAAISRTGQGGTVKTDETTISSRLAVSTAASVAVSGMPEPLSSVLAVLPPTVFEKPVDWHALDVAYLVHHFNCPNCIAAGRGNRYGFRCGIGAVLWRAYGQANQPGGKRCDLTPNED